MKIKTTIKKINHLVLLICAMLITANTFAQGGPQNGRQQGPPPVPNSKQIKEMVSDMAKEISLNEDQEAEMLGLYTTHFKEVKEKTKSGRPDRKEMEALRTVFEKEVKAILTEEQQELYKDYQKKNSRKGRK